MKFSKMHACGNDYIYILSDATSEKLSKFAIFASDRHKGVGGDGVIALSRGDGYDAEMRIFNRDGSEADMCGNGVRCSAEFLRDFAGIKKNDFIIKTRSKTVEVELTDSGGITEATAKLDMPFVFLNSEKLSRVLSAAGLNVNKNEVFAINAGNEHLVFYGETLPADKLAGYAEASGLFDNGINVEKAELHGGELDVSVYERGSGYTLACGSGAIAVAYSAFLKTGGTQYKINTEGGTLSVCFKNGKVRLSGAVNEVFRGEIDYEI